MCWRIRSFGSGSAVLCFFSMHLRMHSATSIELCPSWFLQEQRLNPPSKPTLTLHTHSILNQKNSWRFKKTLCFWMIQKNPVITVDSLAHFEAEIRLGILGWTYLFLSVHGCQVWSGKKSNQWQPATEALCFFAVFRRIFATFFAHCIGNLQSPTRAHTSLKNNEWNTKIILEKLNVFWI